MTCRLTRHTASKTMAPGLSHKATPLPACFSALVAAPPPLWCLPMSGRGPEWPPCERAQLQAPHPAASLGVPHDPSTVRPRHTLLRDLFACITATNAGTKRGTWPVRILAISVHICRNQLRRLRRLRLVGSLLGARPKSAQQTSGGKWVALCAPNPYCV